MSHRSEYQSAMILKTFYAVEREREVESVDLHGFYE
jgi:hypothetical protein